MAATDVNVKIRATDENTGSIFDRLTGRMENYNKSFDRVNKQHKVFKEFSENSGISRLTEGFKGLGEHLYEMGKSALEAFGILGGVGGLLSITGFVEATKQAAEFGKQMSLMSQYTHLTVSDLQALKFAAEETGGNFEGLAQGFGNFRKELAQAQLLQNPAMLAQLMSAGISIERAMKNPLATQESMLRAMFKKYGGDANLGKRMIIEQQFGFSGSAADDAALERRIMHGQELDAQMKKEHATDSAGAKILQGLAERYATLDRVQRNLRDALTISVSPGLNAFLDSLNQLVEHSFPADGGMVSEFLFFITDRVKELDLWLNTIGNDGRTGWQQIRDGLVAAKTELVAVVGGLGGVQGILTTIKDTAIIVGGLMLFNSVSTAVSSLWALLTGVSVVLDAILSKTLAIGEVVGGSRFLAAAGALGTLARWATPAAATAYAYRPYALNEGEDEAIKAQRTAWANRTGGMEERARDRRDREILTPAEIAAMSGKLPGLSRDMHGVPMVPEPLTPSALRGGTPSVSMPMPPLERHKLDVEITTLRDGSAIVTGSRYTGSFEADVSTRDSNNPMGDGIFRSGRRDQ